LVADRFTPKKEIPVSVRIREYFSVHGLRWFFGSQVWRQVPWTVFQLCMGENLNCKVSKALMLFSMFPQFIVFRSQLHSNVIKELQDCFVSAVVRQTDLEYEI
jgi:hypothetical protein